MRARRPAPTRLTPFVLLHLLKGDPEVVRELGLRHAANQPLRANSAAHVYIVYIGSLDPRPALHLHAVSLFGLRPESLVPIGSCHLPELRYKMAYGIILVEFKSRAFGCNLS